MVRFNIALIFLSISSFCIGQNSFNKKVEINACFSRDSVLANDTMNLFLYFKNNSNETLELYPKGFICIQHDANMFITYESAERDIYIINSVSDYDSVVFLNPQEVFMYAFSIKAKTDFFYIGENNVFVFYRGKQLDRNKKIKKEEIASLISPVFRMVVYSIE